MNGFLMRALCFFLSMALSLGSAAESKSSAPLNITLLHTNDIHGHIHSWTGWEGELEGKTVGGMDRIAGAIKQVRDSRGREQILLLDAGDTLGDTEVAADTKGSAVIEIMNAIGYDAMVVGNHEPDFGPDVLKERMKQARFPILAANVVDAQSGVLYAKPYLIKTVNGVKVGIVGLAYPNTALTTARKNVAGLQFDDPQNAAAKYIPKMREDGAQIIVVLSHYGLSADRELAKAVPGIDVIVGGHSHNRMKEAIREGQTLIVQAGAHGSDLGRLDLTIENGRVLSHRRSLIVLEHKSVAADPQITALIEQNYKRNDIEPAIAEAVGPIIRAQTLADQEPAKRDQQSPADSLFADLLRARTGAEVALLPGVGYGVAITQPAITEEQLRNLIPHDSKSVTLTLSGAALVQVLEQAVENVYTEDPLKKVGGMIQVSGIRFRYDPQRPFSERVTAVQIGEDSVDPKRDYRVVTNSLLAEGGHNYKALMQGKNKKEGEPVYNVIKEAITELGKVRAPHDRRINNNSNVAQRVGVGVLNQLLGIDAESCPQCAGPAKAVQAITASEAIQRIFAQFGLPIGAAPPATSVPLRDERAKEQP